jgi:hypothetical protein
LTDEFGVIVRRKGGSAVRERIAEFVDGKFPHRASIHRNGQYDEEKHPRRHIASASDASRNLADRSAELGIAGDAKSACLENKLVQRGTKQLDLHSVEEEPQPKPDTD